MRSGEQAITWGRNQITNPTQSWYRMCLKFVRSCYGVNALYPDAGTAWDKAAYKHRTSTPTAIPRGVPVFFETPGTADHIVLSLGDGLCLTNDWSAPGKISTARIADIARAWNAPLLGWTEDLNGVRVYSPPAPVAKPQATGSAATPVADMFDQIQSLANKIIAATTSGTPNSHAAYEIRAIARERTAK